VLLGRDLPVIFELGAGHDEPQEGRSLGLPAAPVELLGVPGDLQEPDPLLDVFSVSFLVALDSSENLSLLLVRLCETRTLTEPSGGVRWSQNLENQQRLRIRNE
jgi:hypothetical protein